VIDYPLKNEKSLQSPNLLSNDSKVNLEVKEPRSDISKSLSDSSKIDFKTPSKSQNLSSNQNKAQKGTLEAPRSPFPFSHFQDSIIIYHQIKRKPKIA
jgi:hypothetical protein